LRSDFIKIGTQLGEVDRRCALELGTRRVRSHKSMSPQGRELSDWGSVSSYDKRLTLV
jgi:hypothetical protein